MHLHGSWIFHVTRATRLTPLASASEPLSFCARSCTSFASTSVAECSGKVDKNSDRGCDDHMTAASDNSVEK